jgi:GDPmannose 4,6-dehydratase
MFGNAREVPQNENTPFNPRSSYGISKLAGYHLTKNYREAFGIHASSGILYNHESPRRGYEFVTRKITSHVAKIKLGLAHSLKLGNLNAKRDWGHAKDYIPAMWLMLQQPEAGDYVISTGKTHSVKEFLEVAFSYADLNYTDYVVLDQQLVRPAEIHQLLGNSEKAKRILGWTSSTSFEELVHEMVDADLESIRKTIV